MLQILFIAAGAALLVVGVLVLTAFVGKKDTVAGAKRSIRRNLTAFGAIALLIVAVPVGSAVYANGSAGGGAAVPVAETSSAGESTLVAEAPAQAGDGGRGLGFIAAALATGIACLGAGIAVGGAAPAAIGAVSEDPKSFGKSIIFVVLGEGVAIYGLVISILILFLKM